MGSLDSYGQAFNSVGWFIPPYVSLGVLSKLVHEIKGNAAQFTQTDLERFLAKVYSPEHLSAMVMDRYPITPFISDFREIISESVEAHFLGLNHVSVVGLIPVIEGAGKKLANHRGVSYDSVRTVFINLANDCKNISVQRGVGNSDEIDSMMDSFIKFTHDNLYENSEKYPQKDKTNRHGILHGAYSDKDYGYPINFYKLISAVDFLCFVSAFDANISWLAPDSTKESAELYIYYQNCKKISHVSTSRLLKRRA